MNVNSTAQRRSVKLWRQNNPDKVREIQKRYRGRVELLDHPREKRLANEYMSIRRQCMIDEDPEGMMFKSSKDKASARGIEFTITQNDITIPESCPLLNMLIFFDEDGGVHPYTPSLDRIDNSKGYIPGNVWVISNLANSMKRDASSEQLQTFARNILERF